MIYAKGLTKQYKKVFKHQNVNFFNKQPIPKDIIDYNAYLNGNIRACEKRKRKKLP